MRIKPLLTGIWLIHSWLTKKAIGIYIPESSKVWGVPQNPCSQGYFVYKWVPQIHTGFEDPIIFAFLIQFGEASCVKISPYFSRPLTVLYHLDSVWTRGPEAELQLLLGHCHEWRQLQGDKWLWYWHNLPCKLLQGFGRGSAYNLNGSLALPPFCLVAPSPSPERAEEGMGQAPLGRSYRCRINIPRVNTLNI